MPRPLRNAGLVVSCITHGGDTIPECAYTQLDVICSARICSVETHPSPDEVLKEDFDDWQWDYPSEHTQNCLILEDTVFTGGWYSGSPN